MNAETDCVNYDEINDFILIPCASLGPYDASRLDIYSYYLSETNQLKSHEILIMSEN